VQPGHLIALIGIAEKQNGQSFVVTAAGAASFFFSLLILRMSRNTENATMRKLMIVFRKTP
jgi:hypothetical protein